MATFALLVVMAEVAGRSLTSRVDARLHVRPLANSGADYYPFLLVGVKIVCALALAAFLARATRARAAADACERLGATVHERTAAGSGHRHRRLVPRRRDQLVDPYDLGLTRRARCVSYPLSERCTTAARTDLEPKSLLSVPESPRSDSNRRPAHYE